MPLRAVAFDFYGTLAHDETDYPKASKVFADFGFELPADKVPPFWTNDVDGSDLSAHAASREAYESWQRQRRQDILLSCGIGADDASLLLDHLQKWVDGFVMEAYPDVLPALQALSKRDLKLAVCSNWDWDLDKAVASTGIDSLIEMLVTSARVGYRKPHPRIFEHLADTLDLPAAEILFVGDNWIADVEGAKQAGMSAVHILRDDRIAQRINAVPCELTPDVERIRTLDALISIVDARLSM